MKKAFITGVNGFVGGVLAKHLSGEFQVIGTDLEPHCKSPDVDHYFPADIRDGQKLEQIFTEHSFDHVYHLAAISSLPKANSSPHLTMEINLLGTISLLDAAAATKSSSRILIVGSSKEYSPGLPGPIDEQAQMIPTSFYGISKLACELCARQYIGRGLDILFSRSFNHTGPGQAPSFVLSDWTRQAALIRHNKQEPVLETGSLEESIDFTDVRDVVRAYQLILDKGKTGEAYNVCSGEGVRLSDVLDMIVSKTEMPVSIKSSQAKLSRTSVPQPAGNNGKLISHTGWSRSFTLDQTIEDLYHYWLTEINNQ